MMSSFKKTLPYILGGCLLTAGCDLAHDGVVVAKQDNRVFVDMDNDKMPDFHFVFNDSLHTDYSVYTFIRPGDSVRCYTTSNGGHNIFSVNGKSKDDIDDMVRSRILFNGKVR